MPTSLMYRTKPANVEAIKWVVDPEDGVDNTDDVIRFLDDAYGGESSVASSINLIVRLKDGQGLVLPHGAWVVRQKDGTLEVLSDETFSERFEEV